MSWFKKKKEVIASITKYYVPEDQIMGLLETFDRADKEKTKKARYALWRKIGIAFPDLDIKWGNWEFVSGDNPLCPYIVELKGGVRI